MIDIHIFSSICWNQFIDQYNFHSFFTFQYVWEFWSVALRDVFIWMLSYFFKLFRHWFSCVSINDFHIDDLYIFIDDFKISCGSSGIEKHYSHSSDINCVRSKIEFDVEFSPNFIIQFCIFHLHPVFDHHIVSSCCMLIIYIRPLLNFHCWFSCTPCVLNVDGVGRTTQIPNPSTRMIRSVLPYIG